MERLLLDERLNRIIKKDIKMSEHTTFRTGGVASYAAFPKNIEELRLLLEKLNEYEKNYMVLGNGSNVLVSDKGIKDMVIFLGELKGVNVSENKIESLSGNMMSEVAKIAMRNSLTGMEFLSGIPGCIGGGVYMNAGAYSGEIKDIIESIKCMDKFGNIKAYDKSEAQFSYRKSIFSENDDIIIGATFVLQKGNEDEIRNKMNELNKSRREKQPLNYPNAGSTFKRPVDNFAGKLIEDAGLKGYSIGGAMVSEKHCGFLINYDNASSSDIYALIKYVQKAVNDKFGVLLEPEIKLIGEFDDEL